MKTVILNHKRTYNMYIHFLVYKPVYTNVAKFVGRTAHLVLMMSQVM